MKLLILSLLLATSNAFMVAPKAATNVALEAASGRGIKVDSPPSKYTTPVREKRMSGINKKYVGADGSTILGPCFRLACEIATMAPLIWYMHSDGFSMPVDQAGLLGAGFHVALAGWIGLQTNRVRAVFDNEAIEFYNLKGMGSAYLAGPAKDARLQRKPNNWLVSGTPNRWNYKTITGYRFYPDKEFPVVCILWEDQTSEGKKHYGSQPHFFPALFNAKHFSEEMKKNNVPYV